VTVSEGVDELRDVSGLLRQLSLGLSTYRLFPGSPDRPGFVASVERIERAATAALATGPVDVEVRAEGFFVAGTALPSEESTARLARACFERRVERLVVQEPPSVTDLQQTYALLSMTPEEIAEQGGAEDVLRSLGVTSILLSALGPSAVEGADHVPDEMAGAASVRMLDADDIASQLRVAELSGAPGRQAEVVFERLRTLVAELSIESGREIDFHATVNGVVSDLPAHLRRSLIELLVDRVLDDPLAERLIGTMSNAELTRALVDLGRDGQRDPIDLARNLASAGIRHLDIVDLTAALEAGREEAGTILAGLEEVGVDLTGAERDEGPGSVTDTLASYLVATERDDVRSMRATLPRSDEQRMGMALLALHDYLTLEVDDERLGEVLFLWAEELRGAVRSRDPERVRELLGAAREGLHASDDERESLFGAYVRQALEPDLVMDLVTSGHADQGMPVEEMLDPFGDVGVEVLLDLLAEEADRERRAFLLSALRRMAPGHLGPVMVRLRDPRWYVVRNAANLLGNTGGAEVLDQLAAATRHQSAQVRKEAVKALLVAGGVRAVPRLRLLASEGVEDVRTTAVTVLGAIFAPEAAEALGDIVRSSADRGLRRLAIDELAEGTEGRSVLHDLSAGKVRPRLPWSLRRYVRRLLRETAGSLA
jgi:HEAT repeats